MVRSVGLVPFALILYAIAPDLPLSAVAILVVGALYLASLSRFTTIAQQRAPAEFRGRVLRSTTSSSERSIRSARRSRDCSPTTSGCAR